MKLRSIALFILISLLAVYAVAQANDGGSNGPQAPGAANPAIGSGPGPETYPERLESVVDAMAAELAEIAQAVREGKVSREQAEYLSMERYYVAMTKFQLLRTMYQPAEQSTAQTYTDANTAPQLSAADSILPPMTCSPDIPPQIVDYLRLTPLEIQGLQEQVSEQCKQVQPMVDKLEQSRRKLMALKLSGKAGEKDIQAAAAEQSQIIRQLIVANSQLETKLYSMLTPEQQRKVDGLLRQNLDSEQKLPVSR